jgi:ssDNA-binding Zn-finger/Zn-ribbon topoisomerase 1
MMKLDNETFINRANNKHNHKYDYALTEYKGWNEKVIIICPIHGQFYQRALDHVHGRGCFKCGIEKSSSKKILSQDNFIAVSNEKHGSKYDYSLLNYRGRKWKVKIICPQHGIFIQTASNHVAGHGCPKCGGIKISNKKKMSQSLFIRKAIAVHHGRYDYNKAIYKNGATRIKIICPEHGEFEQTPSNHLQGSGCPACGKKTAIKKLSYGREEFIEKAEAIHGKKYGYSFVEYEGIFLKIKIVCSKHGEFLQSPHTHLSGSGCPICKGVSISHKLTKTYEDFLKRAMIVHGDRYRYSELSYERLKKPIEIICPKHGPFFQKPEKHIAGHGCTKCRIEQGTFKTKDTSEKFIVKAENVQGKKYDYSGVVYKNSDTKVQIICPKHGIFSQSPESHLSGSGCPVCSESMGEKFIRIYFQSHKIEYEGQKKFEGCRNKRCLPFDFYIHRLNLCIEYDGEQHYFPYSRYGGDTALKKIKVNDALKNKFCLNNGIRLIRIPYFLKKKEIKTILDSESDLYFVSQEKFEELKAGGMRDLDGVEKGMLAQFPVG